MANSASRPLDSLQTMAYIIQQCDREKIPYNITKLQKLLYCCYGVVLARFGLRLTDEYPEAWPYGPVFPLTLRSLQFFGADAFKNKATTEVTNLPPDVLALINTTLKHFGLNSASELSRWSHRPGSPWAKASNNGLALYGRLSDSDIRDYFAHEVLA